ncbi:STAS domain-containing protein [Actinoplanes aureus]|jgi:anti-sigma B factor antagonist|uniref:Anti-sigma factor antagonist n=1 Tax=Actinoplanes aureus TaxID=2792083 RepID=A0A931CDT2_9ACTN|nr:STAS domain-containing protein [Actinoplanes aureus]MBG0564701.1 STAS domain-containing protein [Actinoplanes aureus]
MNIVRHTARNGPTTLTLAGDLDVATAGLLDQHVTRTLTEAGPGGLVIDVTNLEFCDSTGVHALIRARRQAHQHGTTFQVTNPCGITRRTLQITGVLEVLTARSGPRP